MYEINMVKKVINKALNADPNFEDQISDIRKYVIHNVTMIQNGLSVLSTTGVKINSDLELFIFDVSRSNGWYNAHNSTNQKQETLFIKTIYKNLKVVSESFNLYKKSVFNFNDEVILKSHALINEFNSTKGFLGRISNEFVSILPRMLEDFFMILDEIRTVIVAMLIHKYLSGNYSTYEIGMIMKSNFENNGLVYEPSDKLLEFGFDGVFTLMNLIVQLDELKF